MPSTRSSLSCCSVRLRREGGFRISTYSAQPTRILDWLQLRMYPTSRALSSLLVALS